MTGESGRTEGEREASAPRASLVISDALAIPLSDLGFQFSLSGGPGGQHVNRTATRVTVRFDVANSATLNEEQRGRLLEALAPRLDSRGVLAVHCQDSRSQARNREIALQRLARLLARALAPRRPRLTAAPSKAAVEKRLAAKRRQSEKKRSRSRREPADEP